MNKPISKSPDYLRKAPKMLRKQYKSFMPNGSFKNPRSDPFCNDVKEFEYGSSKPYLKYSSKKRKMKFVKSKPLMSSLNRYIINLSAHRRKPVYYQLQQLLRERAIKAYNANERNYIYPIQPEIFRHVHRDSPYPKSTCVNFVQGKGKGARALRNGVTDVEFGTSTREILRSNFYRNVYGVTPN
eukprot:TRINITY_DN9845_c0_g1_i6.p1 TRINITY_DN9845_c0_g1~~TRINITY_DN9845_c0_g1_i6.p1  ORF type:complete len:184 (+),score=23.49 TRINITY_DN9845_c0_g1_i6:646-1197(+)